MQRQHTIQWYEKTKRHVESNEPRQVQLFAAQTEIQINQSRTATILQWIHNVKLMIRKVEKLPHNDIRRYFRSSEQ